MTISKLEPLVGLILIRSVGKIDSRNIDAENKIFVEISVSGISKRRLLRENSSN
jgi:hypothetical protein